MTRPEAEALYNELKDMDFNDYSENYEKDIKCLMNLEREDVIR